MGPILIFDKSTLQSLSLDEAVLLDHFFLSNITPIFFVEVLADLEKRPKSGRSPEALVGELALKTPDWQSYPNVHHWTLLMAELSGDATVDMRFGRPIIAGGTTVALEGKTGTIFRPSPEHEALQRWLRHEFREFERGQARSWRQSLVGLGLQQMYEAMQPWLKLNNKPRTLTQAKQLADSIINGFDEERLLEMGLILIHVPLDFRERVISSWKHRGSPPIRKVFPYFVHVVSVDFFFYLAMASELIGRERPSNLVDMAYLYYLPFCMVFTSSDNLHERTVPLFLKEHQSFVKGSALKEDLKRLCAHYSELPQEVQAAGLVGFAKQPPADGDFLVTKLWEKSTNQIRESGQEERRLSNEDSEAILQQILRLRDHGAPVKDELVPPEDKLDVIMVEQMVFTKKGRWTRFVPGG